MTDKTAATIIVGIIVGIGGFITLGAVGLAITEQTLLVAEDRADQIHFVTTNNMIELAPNGSVGAGSAYREAYGWLCIRPKTVGAMFKRSEVIVVLDNPLLVCHWRTR